MFRKNIIIGDVIRRVYLERKKTEKLTITQFAQALGCDRTHIYPIFDSKSIDTDLLIRISKILDYPFLLEYFEDEAPIVTYLVLAEVDKTKMEK